MRDLHKSLRETHIVGRDTREVMVAGRTVPFLRAFSMGLVGVSDAGPGLSMARIKPGFGHVLACFSGWGMVLVNGNWERCGAGMAYLTPPGATHAYHSVRESRWGFAWVWWRVRTLTEQPLM